MELEREIVVLCIVDTIINTSPIPTGLAAALNGRPLRLVLGRYLIPKCIVLFFTIVHLTAGSDVTQEFVGVL